MQIDSLKDNSVIKIFNITGVLVALAITIIVGRVLWVFDRKQRYEDFDLKE